MPLGLTIARHMNHFRDFKNIPKLWLPSKPASWERDDRCVLFTSPDLSLFTHADSRECQLHKNLYSIPLTRHMGAILI